MPRTSLRSLLLTCAFRNALAEYGSELVDDGGFDFACRNSADRTRPRTVLQDRPADKVSLPHRRHTPSTFQKGRANGAVPSDTCLRLPELRPGQWAGGVATALVAKPETPVSEGHGAKFRKNGIRPPVNLAGMTPEAKGARVQCQPEGQLRASCSFPAFPTSSGNSRGSRGRDGGGAAVAKVAHGVLAEARSAIPVARVKPRYAAPGFRCSGAPGRTCYDPRPSDGWRSGAERSGGLSEGSAMDLRSECHRLPG